ncbi:M15 family metallopeptidase [Mycobacterium sp. 852014-52144_SCH5372336]|uniref:M15 family metallopeptidase n=1 Tax=Mycobacterium sp. 852014-52144_SCH5372336 TaxID=1834115 RepID=UPI000A81DD1C|nr:M15 family metallopeptidase [Mycobacterium sp. 852014-52144_SCH5372336]
MGTFGRAVAKPVVIFAATAVLVQCASSPPPAESTPPPTTTTTQTTTAAAPSPPTTTPPPPPKVLPVTAADLGESWRPGCPLGPERLRRIEIDHLGMDLQTHRGELVVHEDLVPEVIEIFEELREARYPIEKMRTPDDYPGAEDELSMRDNNTSAFNCRDIPGSGNWSHHAYGRAIDINPLINPYIDNAGDLQPANAAPYLDRTRIDPGLLHADDPAVRVFTDRGWTWGGDWQNPKDYQHFEKPE